MKSTKDTIQHICFDKIIPLWGSMPDSFPDFLIRLPEKEKQDNETLLNEFLPIIKEQFTNFPREDKALQKIWKEQIDSQLNQFLSKENILKASQYMSEETMLSFKREAMHFTKDIRHFDPALSMDDIWQALRNYLIFGMIRELEGEKQLSTPSVLCYSLLYPYTDNFIDDASLSKEEKGKYNQMISDILTGKEGNPQTALENNTCRLLHTMMSEDQIKCDSNVNIADLLLCMLDAQRESLSQQSKWYAKPLSEETILHISTYKGGVSVLVDYYLADSEFQTDKMEFYLAFGLILQLADDLQDIKEDKKKHSHTLMTYASQKHDLEKTINRLFHFIHHVIPSYHPENDRLKEFVLNNCYLMILESVFSNREYLSSSYLGKMEQYLPISNNFLSAPPAKIKLSESEKMAIFDAFLMD